MTLSEDCKLPLPQCSLPQADTAADSPLGAEVGFGDVHGDGGTAVGIEYEFWPIDEMSLSSISLSTIKLTV